MEDSCEHSLFELTEMVSMECEPDSLCDWETVEHPEGGLLYCWSEWEWEFERVRAVSDQQENKKVQLWSFMVARKSGLTCSGMQTEFGQLGSIFLWVGIEFPC